MVGKSSNIIWNQHAINQSDTQEIELPVQKNQRKKQERTIKEKALATHGKHYKGYCNKCGSYGHKSTNKKCPTCFL